MTLLKEKIFDAYEVSFPLENKLSIVIGENGTGKTQILKALKRHFEEENKKVIYLGDNRHFSFSEKDAYWLMFEEETIMKQESVFKKYDIQSDKLDIKDMEGEFIYSGKVQLANLFCLLQQSRKEKVIVVIDEPERNISLGHQSAMLEDILKYPNVEKLIVSTHSPEILSKWYDEAVLANDCVRLY
jgi:predicted ATP-dependent endonuclease of OLD family